MAEGEDPIDRRPQSDAANRARRHLLEWPGACREASRARLADPRRAEDGAPSDRHGRGDEEERDHRTAFSRIF